MNKNRVITRNPTLNQSELLNGCDLLIDSGADTFVVGKHGFVTEIIEGVSVSAQGFSDAQPQLEDLPIVNAVYAYDDENSGEVILLEVNHCIYLGSQKNDAIACPNQMRVHGVHVDDRPRSLFPNEKNAQSILVNDITLPLKMRGPLVYLPVRRPSLPELNNDNLRVLELTSPHGWDPYAEDTISTQNMLHFTYGCKISTFLSKNSRLLGRLLSSHKRNLSPSILAARWGIGIETARLTLNATYQEYTRSTDNLHRRFKTARVHSRYRQLHGPFSQFYTDVLFFNVQSIRGNTCGQVYFNRARFYKFYPLKSKRDSHTTLIPLIEMAGIPSGMHSDRAPDLIAGKYRSILQKYRIRSTTVESNSPWQNRAEGEGVKPIKKLGNWLLHRRQAPLRLWDYAYEHAASILTLTCTPNIVFGEQTGYQIITQLKPDISQYASFDFYSWVWHWDETLKVKKLGRWLGVAETVGPVMTFWILPVSCTPIPRSSVILVQPHELQDKSIQSLLTTFTDTVNIKIGDNTKYVIPTTSSSSQISLNPPEIVNDKWDGDSSMLPFEPTSEESAMEQLDEFIGSQIPFETKNGPALVKVISRKRHSDGSLIGSRHNEPKLDSRIYSVQFPDGHFEEYSANVLHESLSSQLDDQGYDTGHIKEICGYRFDSHMLSKANAYVYSKNGNKSPVITTKGCDIRIRWRDESTTWVPMNVIKNCEPLLLAEYAERMNISHEPVFNWWVKYTLKKKPRLLSKLQTAYHKNNLKFGLEVPKNYKDALAIDARNNNHFWRDAIDKEMTNVKVAFKFLGHGMPPPVGFTHIRCHIIFDVKMDLTRKARFVAGGHMTAPPSSMTYASVVSRESVRIAFLLAALNNCEILAGDIGNAYLNAYTSEKIYYRAGQEWGKALEGTVCVIVRALYGLKSSANAWRTHFCNTLHKDMGFQYSYADNDFWMKQDTRPDGTSYYTYILVYVDDVLIISHDPSFYMQQLKSKYFVKPDSVGPPKIYLGAEIKKTNDRRGKPAWSSSSNKYVKEAITVVKQRMTSMDMAFTTSSKNAVNPFSNTKYRPELDFTTYCTEKEHHFFQQLIGILRWMIELGRIDILTEVSLMSRYLAQPRIGHLQQVLHIFAFLNSNECPELCFDPTKLNITEPTILPQERAEAKAKVMRSMYPDAIDFLPPNMPPALGKSVQINAFVDADHAGELTTRRSQTGILIYGNMAPLIWFSKRQNTVEASTFGSEFVAMRVLVEMLIALRYKLRMFGVPIDGPCNVFCDNQSVTNSSMRAESTLKKKHLSISYHQAREAVACGVMLVFYEHSKSNHADLFTKVLNHLDRRRIMGYICGKTTS